MKITSQTQYEQCLEELWSLWDSPPNTPEQTRFIELSNLVDEYEREHYVIHAPISTREYISTIIQILCLVVGMIGMFICLVLSFASGHIIPIVIVSLAFILCSHMSHKTLRYMVDDFKERRS